MSSKFFGNKSVKQSDQKKGVKLKLSNQNKKKAKAVRTTGRGK